MRTRRLSGLLVALVALGGLLALLAHGARAASPGPFASTQDNTAARRWLAATLAHGGTLPFSFDYDGRPSAGLLSAWTRHHATTRLDAQRTRDEYVFRDSKTGLTVRCVAVRYADFPAVEWTVFFRNDGRADTPLLSNIQALDLRLARPGDVTLHYSTGSHAGADDYQPRTAALAAGTDLPLGGASGWSTTEVLSYFNLSGPDGGLLIGLGWPGNWKARFTRDAAGGGLRVLAGQGLTRFVLHPGEEARSPLVALQFYAGGWMAGQNQWRRWMMAHNLPRAGGRLPPPILASAAPEIGGLHYSAANEVAAIDRTVREGLPVGYWWIDAGWYPHHGDWYNVGTWREDPAQFPGGLRAVTDHARAKGLKQILWFEPERVTPGTDLDAQHPEWLIKLPGSDNRLFNLGLPAAREFLTDLISRRITEYGVDLYRQDFNFDPLPYWRSQDAPDRQGLTENKYVAGFLSFWDGLRARHPGMFIDACASGGRRDDLEVLRRAIPLLQSDYRFEPNGTQGHGYGVALWMPYHGTGGPDRYGDDAAYLFRSHMGPCHTYGPDVGDPHMDYALLNRLAGEEKQVQPYFFGDYYPLTPWSLDNGVWMAWQYDRPDLSSGVVEAFRRPGSGEPSRTFRLSGLDPKSRYRVHDFDTGQDSTRTGAELMGAGLTLTLPHRPASALLLYRRLGAASGHP